MIMGGNNNIYVVAILFVVEAPSQKLILRRAQKRRMQAWSRPLYSYLPSKNISKGSLLKISGKGVLHIAS